MPEDTPAGVSPPAPNPPTGPEEAFIKEMIKLIESSPGDRANLKRNCGNDLAGARNCMWFYRLIRSNMRAETCFLVATLMCTTRKTQTARAAHTSESFGRTLTRIRSKKDGTDPIDRRFAILLDASGDENAEGLLGSSELGFRLRQLVKLLDSQGHSIGWTQLLRDLNRWGHPTKRTQKAWARDFYRPGESDRVDTDSITATPSTTAVGPANGPVND